MVSQGSLLSLQTNVPPQHTILMILAPRVLEGPGYLVGTVRLKSFLGG